jgi:hypothetical protein
VCGRGDVEHYHQERNHQGLDNRLIAGTSQGDVTTKPDGARAIHLIHAAGPEGGKDLVRAETDAGL